MPDNADLKYEELNGEIVVLDAGAGVVHRLSGDAAEAVRAESDELSRRRVIGSLIALGVAAGVTTLALPAAAAAASGGGSEPALGSSYNGYAGDGGVSAPTGVSAEPGDSAVTVRWTGSLSATGYRVYVRVSGGMTYTLAWRGTGTTATVSPLVNGTTYEFIVVAVQNLLVSAQSQFVTAKPDPVVLPTPVFVTVNRNTTSLELIWSMAGALPPSGYDYQLYRPLPGSLDPAAGSHDLTASGYTSANVVLLSGLLPGTNYNFRVRSVYGPNVSGWAYMITSTEPELSPT